MAGVTLVPHPGPGSTRVSEGLALGEGPHLPPSPASLVLGDGWWGHGDLPAHRQAGRQGWLPRTWRDPQEGGERRGQPQKPSTPSLQKGQGRGSPLRADGPWVRAGPASPLSQPLASPLSQPLPPLLDMGSCSSPCSVPGTRGLGGIRCWLLLWPRLPTASRGPGLTLPWCCPPAYPGEEAEAQGGVLWAPGKEPADALRWPHRGSCTRGLPPRRAQSRTGEREGLGGSVSGRRAWAEGCQDRKPCSKPPKPPAWGCPACWRPPSRHWSGERPRLPEPSYRLLLGALTWQQRGSQVIRVGRCPEASWTLDSPAAKGPGRPRSGS